MSAWNPTVYSRNIPLECRNRLGSLRAEGHRILCVAFPPAGGNRWCIVTDKDVVPRNIPTECRDRIQTFRSEGHRILCVAFPPEGGNRWSVITDRDFFNRGVSQACHDRMRALRNDGHKIRWVAFPAVGNRWSILTDRDFVNQGVPAECDTQMKAFRDRKERVISVAFPMSPGLQLGGNRFSICTESGAFFNRDTPPGCHRVMRAMSHAGVGRTAMVGFHPGGGYVVVSDASPEGSAHPAMEDNGEVFSLTGLAEALRDQLDRKEVVKYGFVIRRGPALRAWASGPKRSVFDAPAADFSVFDCFNPASTTKTITSVALLQLLHARGLNVNARIWRWLPEDWTIPASVRTITVAELLNHRSGFREGDVTYAGLRKMVEAGIRPQDKTYCYKNPNYGLARILVAILSGRSPAVGTGPMLAATTALGFRSYCQENIFDRFGVPGVQWKPESEEPTLFYPNPPLPNSGTTYGDWTNRPGSAGAHLSLAELATFVSRLAGGDSLLPQPMRTAMEEGGLGWYRGGSGRGLRYEHGGFFPADRNGGAQLHSVIFGYANGVHGALVFNGINAEVGFDLTAAYDEAWQKPALRAVSRTRRITLIPVPERIEAMRGVPGWEEGVAAATAVPVLRR
ncbi:MAG: class A beta-lactamase-related serine hydrolase [Gemmatimonadales bacterium]|nr:MAG: class A beta-lactamase-related serine hydrolase [Gemmatimonadales bacterium]